MKGKGHTSLTEEDFFFSFLVFCFVQIVERVKSFYVSHFEDKISHIFYVSQFEDKISHILLDPENEFLNSINKTIKLILEDTFSTKSSDSISLADISKKAEQWLKSDVYSPTKKFLNDSYNILLEKMVKNSNSSPLNKNRSID